MSTEVCLIFGGLLSVAAYLAMIGSLVWLYGKYQWEWLGSFLDTIFGFERKK